LLAAALPNVLQINYLKGVLASDTPAYSLGSAAVLKPFPAAFQLAGSRHVVASILTAQHRRLTALDVTSELQLFDGLGYLLRSARYAGIDGSLPTCRHLLRSASGIEGPVIDQEVR
jgi:hypothetical protein